MPSKRYAVDIVVPVAELEAILSEIEHSYTHFRPTGDGYSRLPEWRRVKALLRRSEEAALRVTFCLP